MAPSRTKVASLLSLDMSGAFPNVSHDRLLHNLRRKGVPTALIQWTASFLANRQTTLVLGRWQSPPPPPPPHRVSTGIPQRSPISPILFLFFNAGLVEHCAQGMGRVTGLGFVDDVNILACGDSTEDNCHLLEKIHNDCLAWASRHGAAFAPQKYELMHLTRSRKFNMSASVQLPGGPKAPSPTVRVLGVLLDSKLRWGPHIRRTCDRAVQQCRALTALSGSTWGASFAKARLIYSAVVRPYLTYGATIWAPLQGTLRPAKRHWIGEPLERIQQQCLRAVTGAFKATNHQALEKEAAIPPLRAHIARLQLQARARLEASGARQEIDGACRRLRGHLAPRHGPHRPAGHTPGKERRAWAKDILWQHQRHMEDISNKLGLPPWPDNPRPGPAPAPPFGRPTPQTLWQAYQLAEQWCWDRWKELKGGPPPPHRDTNPDPGWLEA